jgi:hypothetical protein
LTGQGIFHGDQDFFLSLNCPECNEGQFRDQKKLIYEIFQHKILKSQSFKKRAVYWYFYARLNIFSYTGDNLEKESLDLHEKSLDIKYQIIDKKSLYAENAPKLWKKFAKT